MKEWAIELGNKWYISTSYRPQIKTDKLVKSFVREILYLKGASKEYAEEVLKDKNLVAYIRSGIQLYSFEEIKLKNGYFIKAFTDMSHDMLPLDEFKAKSWSF